ncbi:hypothetical protein Daus18300_012957 [Diaporthe australafricana]|uniref:Cell wall protein n=1 Tax=Diaporthe australafricana TaxID=127596 RepID=A0ABR3W113_9PEZI
MLPSSVFSRPLAIASLAYLALLCLISLGESLRVLSSVALAGPQGQETIIKRTWESEQGPFSTSPPDNNAEEDKAAAAHTSHGDSSERLGVPGLSNPLPPINSIVASVLGGGTAIAPVPGLPTPPVVPSPPGASGGLFNSVISVLAGAPSAVPTSPDGNGGSLGGLLSALSQVSPVSVTTSAPVVPPGSGGLLSGLNILGGVAEALDNALGSSEDNDIRGDGILGQLSANIIGPIASIAADPVSILANPTAALGDLQSQVSSVLESLPSAVAAGVQLASNVGGEIADALDAATEVLDSVPEVAGGVADQVGSLLNAAPNLATGLPAAALSAVNQVESVLTALPGLDGDLTGILGGLKEELSSAVANAAPEVTSLAAVVGSQIVGVLPSVLQAPVQGVVSSLQNDMSGLLCQVSDVVSGTAIIFNVPCSSVQSSASDLGAGDSATVTAAISASITVGETLPLVSLQLPSTSLPPLASVLSSLSSSLMTAETVVASDVDPVANSALSDLSSLFSQVSELSLTAAAMPSTQVVQSTGKPLAMLLPSRVADLSQSRRRQELHPDQLQKPPSTMSRLLRP